MRSVMFNFRLEVTPERRDAVLASIGSWDGVRTAGYLKPGSKSPEILRMCYLYPTEDADADDLVKRLSQLEEVEQAFIPAQRRLL